MSQTTGKTSTYIKNANVKESSQIQTGFKKIRFLHQATGGDTLIQLGSLVTPTGAVNYAAPSAGELAQTNMLQWPGNVSLVSSVAGRLIQNISYVITAASTIKLLYDAQDGEIFEGTIDYGVRQGTTLVDSTPINSSGTLTAGSTDFNVGTPFSVGLYSSSAHGAVLVYVDKVLMYRNTGNNAPGAGIDGDYYEVHAGAGLGTLIRFNTPDLVNDRQVSVVSLAGQVERPNGSLMAVAEALQGQIDSMVPTLAALADVSETTFQGAPNNVDLKAFGDRVFTLERILDLSIPIITEWAEYTPVVTGFGTITPSRFVWRQVRDTIEIDGYLAVGTAQAVLASMSLPTGATISTAKFNKGNTTSGAGHIVGEFGNNGTSNTGYVVTATGTDASLVYFGGLNNGAVSLIPQLGNAIVIAAAFAVKLRIPVAGLSQTQTIRQALGI